MIIDLKKIFVNEGASLPIEYALDLSDVEYQGIFPLKKPVILNGAVFHKAGLVRLQASVSFEFEAGCDRCGANVAHAHTVTVDKALAPSIEGEESETILLTPDMKLDLDELLYSEVIVALPMKHLCREDCKGICSRCGKNLNDGNCDCPEREPDPRWSALAELFNDETST